MAQRGRPKFRPTDEQRDQVEILVSGGMTHEDIATAIGISKPTLEKHFRDELAHGGPKKRAEVLGMLYAAARKGNVTAQKKLHEITGVQAAAAEWEAATGPSAAPKSAPSGKLGKKEQARIAAATAGEGSEWGDDLNPSRLPN